MIVNPNFLEQIEDTAQMLIDCGVYLDSITILMAVEKKVHGELCQDWVAVPDPCHDDKTMENVMCQFRFNGGSRNVQQNFTSHSVTATVDIPGVMPWLTTKMRIRYQGVDYRIESIQPDLTIATRLIVSKDIR